MKSKALLTIVLSSYFLMGFSQQVIHTDNTIIWGSQCTGADCTTSESFGFDIHRYKESNLRIHFDDATTNSSSFPKNDWRITINDSNLGGDEYFSIDDATAGRQVFRIEAGSPLDAMYMKSNGQLGLGTNIPQKMIHLMAGANPGIRLEQDTSSDRSPKIWDLTGNEYSFDLVDVSNSSSTPFTIVSKAPSESIVIDSTGNIGMGTSHPSAGLHLSNRDLKVEGSIYSEWNTSNPDTSLLSLLNSNTTVNPEQKPAFTVLASGKMGIGTSTPAFDLQVAGDVDVTGELTAASDKRLKKDITSIKEALNIITNLNPVSYLFRTHQFPSMHLSTSRKMGLIAQEVENVLPNLVVQQTETHDKDGNEFHLKSVNYMEMIPLLIKGMQEQQLVIEEQGRIIDEIKAENINLQSLNNALLELRAEVDRLMRNGETNRDEIENLSK